jgi:hypothetical protein
MDRRTIKMPLRADTGSGWLERFRSVKAIEAFTHQTGHELMRQGEMLGSTFEFLSGTSKHRKVAESIGHMDSATTPP